VGVLVVVEPAAHVLDVEAGLVAGVEPLDQLLERRLPGDDHDPIPHLHHGDPPPDAAEPQSTS
jgi:hypothetical protein